MEAPRVRRRRGSCARATTLKRHVEDEGVAAGPGTPKASGLLPRRASRPPVGAMVVLALLPIDAREAGLGREPAVGRDARRSGCCCARARCPRPACAHMPSPLRSARIPTTGPSALPPSILRDRRRDLLDREAARRVDRRPASMRSPYDSTRVDAVGVVAEEVAQHQDARAASAASARAHAEAGERARGELARPSFVDRCGHSAVIFAVAHDLGPLLGLGVDELRELLGRARRGSRPWPSSAFTTSGSLSAFTSSRFQYSLDLLRRLARHHERIPVGGLEPGVALLGHRGHVGHDGRALQARRGERARSCRSRRAASTLRARRGTCSTRPPSMSAIAGPPPL